MPIRHCHMVTQVYNSPMKRRRAAADTTTAVRVLRSAPHTTLTEAATAAGMTHTQIRLCINQATSRGRCAQKTAAVLHNSLRHEPPSDWTSRQQQRLLLTHRMCPPPAARAVTAELAAQVSAVGERIEATPETAGTPGWAARADYGANTAPASLLRSQASNDDQGVRSVTAGNSVLPQATLEALSDDAVWMVMWATATNESCPQRIFARFVAGDESELRETVAMNHACPPELLTHIGVNGGLMEQRAAARNPSCPSELFTHFVHEDNWEVVHDVAGNPSCPSGLLEQLADHEQESIRRAVSENPHYSPDRGPAR